MLDDRWPVELADGVPQPTDPGPQREIIGPSGESRLQTLYWAVQIQTVDVARLDPYLASVADQEDTLGESPAFAGRLVLRSQRRPDRFWLVDAWTDRYSLEAGAITLRTLCSVAALVEEPREIPTEQVPVGSAPIAVEPRPPRAEDDPLPFFMIAENRVRPVVLDDYLAMQDQFARDLENEAGFVRRLLLRDVRDAAHFLVIDEWESERHAFEAFQRREAVVSEITTTRFLSLLADRGELDFALGLHG